MSANRALIELKDIKKIYKMGKVEVRALDGVSLSVKKGEFISIVGKSGSGKSTLVNQVGCLDTPTEGTVLLDGLDIAKMSESDLAQVRGQKIGFIFQTFNLMPTLSVYENVSLPMSFQGLSSDKIKINVDNALKLVDLSDRGHHKPGELSGGQRQRVAIARALAGNPEVILADEPTGNLDSKTGLQIMQFLLQLHEKHGATIIMVTHDDDLAQWTQRTITLSDGKVIKETAHSQKERNAAMKRFEEQTK